MTTSSSGTAGWVNLRSGTADHFGPASDKRTRAFLEVLDLDCDELESGPGCTILPVQPRSQNSSKNFHNFSGIGVPAALIRERQSKYEVVDLARTGDIPMHPAARPAGPAADHARIQPDTTFESTDDIELDEWLDDREFDNETDRLHRLGGDEEILLHLQLHEFDDASWEPVAQELARYGIAVIGAWIRRATIYGKVRSRTRYPVQPLDGWPADVETVRDIATDTVLSALKFFKTDVLMRGRWDPRRGASLRTYFIGQCLFQFPNHFRSYRNTEIERRKSQYLIGDDADLDALMGSTGDVESEVLTRCDVEAALATVPTERLRTALTLRHLDGHSYQEIAERLGLRDAKQVENMLTYFYRTQARRTA